MARLTRFPTEHPKGSPSWNILGSGGSSVLPPKEMKFLEAGCYTGNTGSKPGPNSPPHTLQSGLTGPLVTHGEEDAMFPENQD